MSDAFLNSRINELLSAADARYKAAHPNASEDRHSTPEEQAAIICVMKQALYKAAPMLLADREFQDTFNTGLAQLCPAVFANKAEIYRRVLLMFIKDITDLQNGRL